MRRMPGKRPLARSNASRRAAYIPEKTATCSCPSHPIRRPIELAVGEPGLRVEHRQPVRLQARELARAPRDRPPGRSPFVGGPLATGAAASGFQRGSAIADQSGYAKREFRTIASPPSGVPGPPSRGAADRCLADPSARAASARAEGPPAPIPARASARVRSAAACPLRPWGSRRARGSSAAP